MKSNRMKNDRQLRGIRRFLPLLAAGLTVSAALLLGACGKQEKPAADIDIPAAVQAVLGAGGYTEELVALDDSTIVKTYPTLDLGKIEAYSCNVSGSMGTPEEVSIFKAKTADDVAAVRAAVDRRVEDQQMSFEDYRPDEMPKIENAVIVEKGNYVMLAVCAEYDAARGVLEKL